MIARWFWLLLAVVGWLLLRRLLRREPASRPAAPGSKERTRVGEPMVRDRICNTFLPRSKAIVHRDKGGAEHFFCSESCRSAYLARTTSDVRP